LRTIRYFLTYETLYSKTVIIKEINKILKDDNEIAEAPSNPQNDSSDSKEIHIWMGEKKKPSSYLLYNTLGESMDAIDSKMPMIHTTQTALCTTYNMSTGYQMFVHMLDGEKVEIKFGYNEKLDMNIRMDTNLEKILLRNGFGLAVNTRNLMPI
jgi:hypothetical protein